MQKEGFYPQPLFGFGRHPSFQRDYNKAMETFYSKRDQMSFEESYEVVSGKTLCVSEFHNPKHPEVFLIPRDQHIKVVDEYGDRIGIMQTMFPFSSTDFYVDFFETPGSVFYELYHAIPFIRLGGIAQLESLVPPRPDDWDKEIEVCYCLPPFSHTRWLHSLITAILMELVLANNGFSKEERAPIVLTAGSHDIATPAGGDTIMRLGPEMDEEKNFSWVMRKYGLDETWTSLFGFDLNLAQKWVKGQGVMGKLLDIVDKMSYTAIDCYRLGQIREGNVRNICLENPLLMDVWQDVRLTKDRQKVYFLNPESLFNLLLLRVYEFKELLLNPYARMVDFLVEKLTKPFYKKGDITREDLLTWKDEDLFRVLQEKYPEKNIALLEPEQMEWRVFETKEQMQKAVSDLGNRVDHTEHLDGFSSGLDWLVLGKKNELKKLRETIGQKKVKIIEEVIESTKGYYVYYYK